MACLFVLVCVVVFQNEIFEGEDREKAIGEQEQLFAREEFRFFSRPAS